MPSGVEHLLEVVGSFPAKCVTGRNDAFGRLESDMPRGRPPKALEDRTRPLQLRLYQVDFERLDRLTDDGRSQSEVIREAIALLEASEQQRVRS